jgi:beta-N-acetylhexosaminidase
MNSKKYDRRDHIKPVIFGVEGKSLNSAEMEFFGTHNPLGFIIFSRNIEDPEQLRRLIMQVKATVFPRNDVLILIDQEGGRVARLKPPCWPEMPAARSFAEQIPFRNAQSRPSSWYITIIACVHMSCASLASTLDCAPLVDLIFEGADDIIGDRSFSSDPYEVAELGKEVCKAMLMGNVFPVIKHIPGHGRANCDSHKDLPVGERHRWKSFVKLILFRSRRWHDMPFAMTAHITYTAIDDRKLCYSVEKSNRS